MKRWLFFICVALAFRSSDSLAFGRAAVSDAALSKAFSGLDASHIKTGILYDRVAPLSGVENFDGSAGSKPVILSQWRQIYFELSRAAVTEPAWPSFDETMALARKHASRGRVPIGILNFAYNRIRSDAREKGLLAIRDGRLVETGENPYIECRAFAACAFIDHTFRGGSMVFEVPDDLYLANSGGPERIEIDFDDGAGYRRIRLGEGVSVSYTIEGTKTIRVRAYFAGGAVLESSFLFNVEHLETPMPDDTLSITAAIPYQGTYGTGQAYILRSHFNLVMTKPVIVVEGFDLDNTMNWDELYSLLNQEQLAETLHDEGYDLVLLNFTDATDYLQRNAYVIVELLEQAIAMIDPQVEVTVIGASMGGLLARYALAFMEANAIDHRVNTFISFDSPQRGGNIPLGIQYWMDFFSGESEEAAHLLERLDTPAARQMLLYHHTDPPGSTGSSDPLRAVFLSDLAAAGNYPNNLRKVAVANGSGARTNQGFTAGDQLIFYEYDSWLVDIRGNVWAVPDGTNHIILQGLIDRFWPLPDDQMNVTVLGTRPLDSAPGGWRSSMAQMDTTDVPYGDIVALYNHHCFIPTVSSLDLDTEDLFYDVAGDTAIMSRTPFDTIYFPMENQEHVSITAENTAWFLREIRQGITAIDRGEGGVPRNMVLHQNAPNPFNPSTMISFELSRRSHVSLEIYSVLGRRIAVLMDRYLEGGSYRVRWNGRDFRNNPVASGVYLCQLEASGLRETKKMILTR